MVKMTILVKYEEEKPVEKPANNDIKNKLEGYVSEGRALIQEISARGMDTIATQRQKNREHSNQAIIEEIKALKNQVKDMDLSGDSQRFIQDELSKLASMQQAQTLELDRLLMSMKGSLDKNIEKSKGLLERHIELTVTKDKKLATANLVFSIMNFLGVAGIVLWLFLQ